MKKRLVVLFCFALLNSKAQDIKVTLSDEFAMKNSSNLFKDVFSDDLYKIGNFYYRKEIINAGAHLGYTAKLRDGLHGLTFYKYDDKMKEISSQKLEGGNKVFGPLGDKFIPFDHRLLLLYYKYGTDDSVRLFVSDIDSNSLSILNSKEIYAYYQRNLGFFGLIANSTNPEAHKLHCSISPDSSKLLVQTIGNTGEIFTIVIEKGMNLGKEIKSVLPENKESEINDICIDNLGNRYVSYGFKTSKRDRYFIRGVLIQNVNGKESAVNIPANDETAHPKGLLFCSSKLNSKVNVYADYEGEHMCEGVLMSSIDALGLKIKPLTIYPYPEDFKKRIYQLDFGDRSRGDYSVIPINYSFNELDNGTTALTGVPILTLHGEKYSKSFGGPIIVAFIKNDKCTFSMIPRNQHFSEASSCIATGYKNNLICIYTDKDKNINAELSDNISDGGKISELKLAVAVMNSDGTIVSRKKIGDDPIGSNYYFLDDYQKVSSKHIIFSIGRERVSLVNAYTEKVQMVDLEIK